MSFVDPYLLLTSLFATAVALAWVTKRIGLSYVAGYVAAGVLLSLLAPGVRGAYAALLDVFSDVAIALLALEIGREVGLENIKRLGVIPFAIVLGEVLASFTLMTIMGLVLKLSWIDVAVLTLISSCCSTATTYKLMQERGFDPDKRRLVLLVATADDVAAITFLALLPQISRGYASLFEALKSVLSSLVVAAVLVVVGVTLMRPLFAKIVRPDEFGLATSISLGFAYALISRGAGLSPALGAFAAGLALSAHPGAPEVSKLIRPVTEVFLIVFFVVMGFNANVAAMTSASLGVALLIGTLIVLVRFIAFTYSSWIVSGYGLKGALEMGFFAMTVSEFGLIIAYEAVRLGATAQPAVAIAVLSVIFATTVSSILTRDFERWADRLSSVIPAPVKFLGDQASSYINKALGGEVGHMVRETIVRAVKEGASMMIIALAASSALYAIDDFLDYPYDLALTAVVIAMATFLMVEIVRRLRSHADFLCQEFLCRSGVPDPRVKRLLSGLVFISLMALTVLLALLVASKYVEAVIDRVLGLDVGHVVATSMIVGLLALVLWSIVNRLRGLASAFRGKWA